MEKKIDGLLQEKPIKAVFEFNDYWNPDAHMSNCFKNNDKEWFRHNLYSLVDIIVERL